MTQTNSPVAYMALHISKNISPTSMQKHISRWQPQCVENISPLKSNVDTNNGDILKGDTFSKPSFLVSMLDFGGVLSFHFPGSKSGQCDTNTYEYEHLQLYYV